MRKLIAAMQITADGYIEGPAGELDWAMAEDEETWRVMNETLDTADTFILGRVMYPDYENYWLSCLTDPESCTENEIAYARRAEKIEHLVLSTTLETLNWKSARIIRSIEEISKIKKMSGKSIIAFGGAATVASLINNTLVDELRLVVNPVILGGGKALFKDVKKRHSLKLLQAKQLGSGKISIIYNIRY